MAKRPTYHGLFKVAKKLTLGKCECGRDIEVDVELVRDEEVEKSAFLRTAEHDDDDQLLKSFEKMREEEDSEEETMSREKMHDADRNRSELEWPESESESSEELVEAGHTESEPIPDDEEVEAAMRAHNNHQASASVASFVRKASKIVDQLDSVANRVESQNPRLAARIDAVSNEIEKRVARLLQRRQNTK